MFSLSHLLSVTFLICVFTATSVLACSCSDYNVTPFQEFRSSKAVFDGEIVGHRDIVHNAENEVIERIFRIRVIETFKGVGTKEVEVSAGETRGMCYLEFPRRAVFYTYDNGKFLGTGMCSRTFRNSTDDVFYLRRAAKGEAEPSVYGRVVSKETIDPTRLSKLRVVLERDGTKIESRLDPQGRFEFKNIQPGMITVSVRPFQNISSKSVTLQLTADYWWEDWKRQSFYLDLELQPLKK